MQIAAYIATAFCAYFGAVYTRNLYKGTPVARLITKTIASVFFCLIGLFAALALPGQALSGQLFILLGLLFGLLGDSLLECQQVFPKKEKAFFLAGLCSFLTGHIFYAVYCFGLAGARPLQFIIAGCVLAVIFLLKLLCKIRIGDMALPALAYALVISNMVGAAIGAAILLQSTQGFLLGAGAVLFLFSDLVLAYIYFGPSKVALFPGLNIVVYYLAQMVFALSILFA